MATPLVHASIGLAIATIPILVGADLNHKHRWMLVFGAGFFACLPDLDIVYSYLATGSPTTFHFGITHTLAFTIAVGGLSALLLPWRYALLGGILVFSHVLVDGFTGPHLGFSPTVGIPALLPLNDTLLVSPVTLFRGIEHSNWLNQHNMKTLLFDTLIYVPVALVSLWVILKKTGSKRVV